MKSLRYTCGACHRRSLLAGRMHACHAPSIPCITTTIKPPAWPHTHKTHTLALPTNPFIFKKKKKQRERRTGREAPTTLAASTLQLLCEGEEAEAPRPPPPTSAPARAPRPPPPGTAARLSCVLFSIRQHTRRMLTYAEVQAATSAARATAPPPPPPRTAAWLSCVLSYMHIYIYIASVLVL